MGKTVETVCVFLNEVLMQTQYLVVITSDRLPFSVVLSNLVISGGSVKAPSYRKPLRLA